ncbi:MAG TPA: aminopeptidase P N-terminal domain-containing protein [Thiobacillaceae bacterium]|nr:aminopeptidase P N-terminal domain-containing protein [Thiobacillaceae bacterium]
MSLEQAIEAARRRRQRVLAAMGDGVMVLSTAPERVRNRDTHHPYRYDSYFHYLSAFPEPEAVLVLVAGDTPRQFLFCREKNEEREVWDGFRFGPEAAAARFGFDEARPVAELDERMSELLADRPVLHYLLGDDPAWDGRVMGWLNAVRGKARTGVTAPSRIVDARAMLDEMRLIKDAYEIELMDRAAAVSAVAHRQAMAVCRPGLHEYEVEAELLRVFRAGGCAAPAYPPIVAGGAHACVLHYVANDQPLNAGDLLLIDAAGEFAGYAADITRTFPVSGRFEPAQRDAYQLVLAAQAAAIGAVRPGNAWNAPHEAALRLLTQGMVDLKLLAGDVDGLIEREAYKRFYMHRTGHWLGRDVHDAGEYKLNGQWRPFVPGMTLTVEPGIYIRPADDVPEALWNIGIRIEDDVLVTEAGCRVLTEAAPKTVTEIEELMRHG